MDGIVCPNCKESNDSKVMDSRPSFGGVIRRRRECLACHSRFTTHEGIPENSTALKSIQDRVSGISDSLSMLKTDLIKLLAPEYRKGFTIIEALVVAVIVIVIMLTISSSAGVFGSDEKMQGNAIRVLQNQGLTNIKITSSFDLFCCGNDDLLKYSFTATGIKGNSVEGCVCGGYFKGLTVRYK